MENLLRSSERRRLQIVKILFDKDDWVSLKELSNAINSSTRVLKYDFANFKETLEDFTIETSHHGVRLVFLRNKGLKTLYKNILHQSTSFQLLETIFFNESYTAFELADALFLSPSTLYRLIAHINEVASEYGFQIETNPCRIVGSEKKIRHFFIKYFYEKYTRLEWPYKTENSEALDNLLYFFIEYTQTPIDFAYYNLFKMITIVNLVRYINKHFVRTNKGSFNFSEIMPDLREHSEAFKYFEQSLNLKVNNKFIHQVFTPFIHEGYSLTKERLDEKIATNKKIADEVHFLSQMLETLAQDHDLPLTNKDEIIFGVQNAAYFEEYDPRAGYILYNRNRHFTEVIQEDFPEFHKDLVEGVKAYRKVVGLNQSDVGIHYLSYVLFTYWNKLTLELRKKLEKINILIISNRHVSHSNMLKDFLEYEFNNHLTIDIYDDIFLTDTILEELEYDFIVANFPLPELKSKNSICIENIPTFHDIAQIQNEMNDILLKRMT